MFSWFAPHLSLHYTLSSTLNAIHLIFDNMHVLISECSPTLLFALRFFLSCLPCQALNITFQNSSLVSGDHS